MAEGRKLRVGILFGGQSAEHEISILSARNVLDALDRSRFDPVLIGITKDGQWLAQDERALLASAKDPRLVHVQSGLPVPVEALVPTRGQTGAAAGGRLDVVFPVLHGTLGEDGAMQGLLEVAGVAYVGAGVLGSAVGMDKDVMKRLLRDAGIPVAEFHTIRRGRFDAGSGGVCEEVAKLGFPLFTKPANAGGGRNPKGEGTLRSTACNRARVPVRLEGCVRSWGRRAGN